MAKNPIIKLCIPAKNRIATNIDVVLISPLERPPKCRNKVLIKTKKQTMKEKKPKINANLIGKSENGANVFSKKLFIIISYKLKFDLPFDLCLLS
tara:strand:+ start:767 stop:1051 length:285 start_codon:yes stop_codon:yes gene_type:complete